MKKVLSITFLNLASLPLWAADAKIGDDDSLAGFFQNPMLMVLSFIAIILLFVIYAMAKVAIMVIKKRTEEEKKNGGNKAKVVTTLALLLIGFAANAQDAMAEAPAAVSSYVLNKEALWAGITVVIAESIIIAYLFYIIKKFSGAPVVEGAVAKESWWSKFLNKMQPLVPIENEGDIDLGHNYDGIRELDNPPPPWWKLAFAATIIFAPIYLYRYHIAHSAPLQLEELAIAIEEGEARKADYLANSPNAIDENNIATMEGIEASAGATIFAKNCVACHGAAGEGNAVGPNLTDVNWIHGGGLTNIFKSVKYGWPEKGMKSWQADLSSLEIAQVSTYVHSIQGSNPPNAKEPQGDVWAEGGAAPAEAAAEPSADSTATAE